jgi:hypothetical protein
MSNTISVDPFVSLFVSTNLTRGVNFGSNFVSLFVSSNGEKWKRTETRETTTDRKRNIKKDCHEFNARRKLWLQLCFTFVSPNLTRGVNFGSNFVSLFVSSNDGKLKRTETHETRTDGKIRKIVTHSNRGQTVRQTIKAFFSFFLFFFDHQEGDILLSLLTTMPAQSGLPPLT